MSRNPSNKPFPEALRELLRELGLEESQALMRLCRSVPQWSCSTLTEMTSRGSRLSPSPVIIEDVARSFTALFGAELDPGYFREHRIHAACEKVSQAAAEGLLDDKDIDALIEARRHKRE